MKTSDFNYHLPEELIAQEPLNRRDSSRLLCISKDTGKFTHNLFCDLPEIFRPKDRLIFNNTKVIPARIICYKESGARIEILFVKKIDNQKWQIIAKPGKRLKIGNILYLEQDTDIKLVVESILPDGSRILSLKKSLCDSLEDIMNKFGSMPLPPYIKRHSCDDDTLRYQTIYAKKSGALAAPTAGLHFTEPLLQKLKARDIDFSFITLHVGIGTFRPVKESNPQNHIMHAETYELNIETAREIEKTKKEGGRIIAVGTTTIRVLEHCAHSEHSLNPGVGSTRLMILPGYKFKIIDCLITNFHLPCSTLIMLVSALAGKDNILKAYNEAIIKRYRFFSYGDAMLII